MPGESSKWLWGPRRTNLLTTGALFTRERESFGGCSRGPVVNVYVQDRDPVSPIKSWRSALRLRVRSAAWRCRRVPRTGPRNPRASAPLRSRARGQHGEGKQARIDVGVHQARIKSVGHGRGLGLKVLDGGRQNHRRCRHGRVQLLLKFESREFCPRDQQPVVWPAGGAFRVGPPRRRRDARAYQCRRPAVLDSGFGCHESVILHGWREAPDRGRAQCNGVMMFVHRLHTRWKFKMAGSAATRRRAAG